MKLLLNCFTPLSSPLKSGINLRGRDCLNQQKNSNDKQNLCPGHSFLLVQFYPQMFVCLSTNQTHIWHLNPSDELEWTQPGGSYKVSHKALESYALTGAAQWVGRCPTNQMVTSWIPSQGTCLSCRPGKMLKNKTRQNHYSFIKVA